MYKPLVTAIVAALGYVSSSYAADLRFSGFVSAYGGMTLDEGDIFLADYPQVGLYDSDLSFDTDSIFGLQVNADISSDFSVTGQIVARGTDGYSTDIEWAYFTYNLTPDWILQGGRKRIPMFYYSDFFDVGYAYNWVRPPADTYTWQVMNYNGLNAQYNGTWGSTSVTLNFYGGSENSDNNKLLTDFFFFEPVDEHWKNMMGVVASFDWEWISLRASTLFTERDRFVSDVQTIENQGMNFNSVSINIERSNFVVLTEYQFSTLDAFINQSTNAPANEADFQAYLVFLGYRIGSVLPYVVYSEFDESDNPDAFAPGGVNDGEHHNTTSVGLRWDFTSSAAFKIQYDIIDDLGLNPGAPGADPNWPYTEVAGDSEAISFGIDAVF